MTIWPRVDRKRKCEVGKGFCAGKVAKWWGKALVEGILKEKSGLETILLLGRWQIW